MVKGKAPKPAQVNSLDRYTVRMAVSGRQQATADEVAPEGELSLEYNMVAIQDLWGWISTIEPKLDAVTVEVKLLQADFGKISEKVKVWRLTLRAYRHKEA
ncbi:hypothetical protein NDU88_005743 [Pleurodeles waltl]|uniref:Uncharacterized protein n=1 Tax=Pleurodeles waltl TaxID=8319 RepID=A0AAV7RLW3_PLEWA|nr:hypothetical protein NDU88_005743 [Pleurodeles waltl]